MRTTHPIARFVQAFFLQYLTVQRGLSQHTVLAYRDCLKLFLRFSQERVGKPVDKLVIEDFDEKLVTSFLDYLETTRGNSTHTRNARLAALHAFFRYVASEEPMVMGVCQQICAIPVKKTSHKTIEYLEDEEICAILNSVDQNSRHRMRDYLIFPPGGSQ